MDAASNTKIRSRTARPSANTLISAGVRTQGVPLSILGGYSGTYAYIIVALDGDHLTAEIPSGSPAARLYPESPTQFFVLDGPQELSFILDSQQNVTGVEFSTSMGHHRLDKSVAH